MYRRRDMVMMRTILTTASRLFTRSGFSTIGCEQGVKMGVSITSVETIKPSLGATHHLEPLKLSILDQLEYSTSIPFIFFYPDVVKPNSTSTSSNAVSSKLKASLSETLNSFYPLSGRLIMTTTNNDSQNMMFIHDFDQGVPFVEARVLGEHRRLVDFLNPPKLEYLNYLLPREPNCLLPTDSPQIAVQLTTFDCGGVALALSFHHRICDGATAGLFLKSWTAFANSGRDICQPDLTGASSVFPPRQALQDVQMTTTHNTIRRGNPRRFVFDNNALSELKSMGKSAQVENPSRTEVISAFIWKSVLKAATESSSPKPVRFAQEVNIRPRMGHPRLSKNSIGNLCATAFATCDETSTFPELVANLRKGVEGIDHKYLNSSSWVEQMFADFSGSEEDDESGGGDPHHDFLAGSSLLRFGLSELDLGLGNPIWVGMFGHATDKHHQFFPWHCSLIMLKEVGAPAINGNATEAWTTLDEDLMAVLEHDPHFLKFASPNPPIVF